jgi:hypothetical protein
VSILVTDNDNGWIANNARTLCEPNWESPTVPSGFEEFAKVTLMHPVEVQGVSMPAGASGVIMETWADGKAYEVEFESPHVVLTIEGADLEG